MIALIERLRGGPHVLGTLQKPQPGGIFSGQSSRVRGSFESQFPQSEH